MYRITSTRLLDDATRREVRQFLDSTAAQGGDSLDDHLLSDLSEGSAAGPVEGFIAVLARTDDGALCGYAQASGGHAGSILGCVTTPATDGPDVELMAQLLQHLLDQAPTDRAVTWWTPGSEQHEAVARRLGMSPGRRLLQMTRPLPLTDGGDSEPLVTRPFRPGTDDAQWLEVNNAAFAWHGEQGGWTLEVLRQRQRAPWFDNYGFLLHEREGRLAGFCWTKVHKPVNPFAIGATVTGEIYVIAVHPDFHGHGLGRALTVAGLQYLHRKGAANAMLYVDADNASAVAMYEHLGFRLARTDVAFQLAPHPA